MSRRILNIFLIFGLVVFFFFVASPRLVYLLELSGQEEALNAQIIEQKEITEQLEKEMEQTATDSFVEKVAREQLGYVRWDEIIFVREK